jgi:hypothetical protein
MKRGPAGPWRRLAPLTVLVLALHLVVLRGPPTRIEPPREDLRFRMRTVAAPPASPSPVATAPATSAPTQPSPPVAHAPLRPRPSPRMAAQAAPAPTQQDAGVAPAAPPRTTAPIALALHPPARLHYELAVHSRGAVLVGQAVLDWKHDGAAYEARLELTAPGYRGRLQRSTGRITSQGLEPGYFSDRYRGEQATHFDSAQGRVVFSANRPQAPWVEGMQDRLSVVLQVAALLAGDPARFPPGTQLELPTAGTREAEPWTFLVQQEEDLQLPGGPVRAIKLVREPRREYDQKLELWLAPGMDYAPVRLRLTTPDGGAVEQRWASTDRS